MVEDIFIVFGVLKYVSLFLLVLNIKIDSCRFYFVLYLLQYYPRGEGIENEPIIAKTSFKTIPSEESLDLVKVAQEIISEERKKGHTNLAGDLEIILKKRLTRESSKPKGKVVPLHDIPTDKRYKIPLAKYVDREELRHHMILPASVEEKIRRIEDEYAGRERLAHFGLKPRKKYYFMATQVVAKV